jgi:cytochrome P450
VNCPYVLDVDGKNIQSEGAALRAEGPIRLIEMPGGVRGWAIAGHDILRELLLDSRVSKDPRQHWPLWINDDLAQDWPLRIWVSVQNMFTSYGSEHRRLRSLVSSAFTVRRTEALRPRIEAIAAGLLDRIENAGQPSPGRTSSTWLSATACTTASARHWPGWRRRSHWAHYSSAFRT